MHRARSAAAFAAVSLASLVSWTPSASAQFVSGHVFVAGWKTTIWEVDPAAWTVTVFADATKGLNGVSGLQYFPGDTLLETNFYDNQVLSFDSTGVATSLWTAAAGLASPYGENGLAATLSGDLYVSNYGAKQVLSIPAGATAPIVVADSSSGVVHADGLAIDALEQLWIVNRDGMNVLKIDRTGAVNVFDTLPDMPMSIAIRNNGDVYVGCFYGDVYRYKGGDATHRSRLVTFNRTLGTPVLRFDLNDDLLYMTSSNMGNLLTVDPDTGKYTEVLPVGTFATPVSLEVVGTRVDDGITTYGAGKTGGLGVVPQLDATGTPILDHDVTFLLKGFLPGSVAFVAIAATPAELPFMGGTLLVTLDSSTAMVKFELPSDPTISGGTDCRWPQHVPNDPQLDGYIAWFQAFDLDPGATHGLSLSNGLKLTLRAR